MHGIVYVLIGGIVLVAGRRLFWLCVALVGFLAGIELAAAVLGNQPPVALLVVSLAAGVVGAVIAVFAERLAFALVGFYAGGYLALSGAGLAAPDHLWALFWMGAIAGAILAVMLTDPAIIVLTSFVGAGAVVAGLHLAGTPAGLLFVVLCAAGIIVQLNVASTSADSNRRR